MYINAMMGKSFFQKRIVKNMSILQKKYFHILSISVSDVILT